MVVLALTDLATPGLNLCILKYFSEYFEVVQLIDYTALLKMDSVSKSRK